ncbi:unnamed protein product, partial [Mesorhabditis belari]|uniref:Uncharacterized protein n=1 Tax=Mesorhabditis belari TaxID=2138241 RepID=A0AAF3ETP5_9BILA
MKFPGFPSTSLKGLTSSMKAPARWIQNNMPTLPSTSNCFSSFSSCTSRRGFFASRKKRSSLSVQPCECKNDNTHPSDHNRNLRSDRKMSIFNETKPKSEDFDDPPFTIADKVMPRRLPPLRAQQFTGKVELIKKTHKATKSSTVVLTY